MIMFEIESMVRINRQKLRSLEAEYFQTMSMPRKMKKAKRKRIVREYEIFSHGDMIFKRMGL